MSRLWTELILLGFAVGFLLQVILTVTGLFVPMPPSVERVVVTYVGFRQFIPGDLLKAVWGIFTNNVRILTVASVPILGVAWLAVDAVVNGWVGRYVALLFAYSWRGWLVSYVWLSPWVWLELSAYGLAGFSGVVFGVRGLVFRDFGFRALRDYLVGVGLSVLLLFFSAVVEVVSLSTH